MKKEWLKNCLNSIICCTGTLPSLGFTWRLTEVFFLCLMFSILRILGLKITLKTPISLSHFHHSGMEVAREMEYSGIWWNCLNGLEVRCYCCIKELSFWTTVTNSDSRQTPEGTGGIPSCLCGAAA